MDRAARLSRFRLLRPKAAGIVAMAIAAGFIAWLVTRSDSGSSTPASTPPAAATAASTATPIGPLALTAGALRARVGSLGQPVYWIGPEPGRRYELQRKTNGSVFLRYLPPGVKVGDERPLRTVGTYPWKGAYAATLGLAGQKGSVTRKLPGGWLAVYRLSRPTNFYLARPGFDYQLELFDPSPAQARQLTVSGRLEEIPRRLSVPSNRRAGSKPTHAQPPEKHSKRATRRSASGSAAL